MPEADYTKREVDQLLKTFDTKIDGVRDDLRQLRNELKDSMTSFEAETGSSLMRIEAQTVKTNGRVNNLERWQSYITGGVAVLAFIITILIAVLAIIAQTGHL